MGTFHIFLFSIIILMSLTSFHYFMIIIWLWLYFPSPFFIVHIRSNHFFFRLLIYDEHFDTFIICFLLIHLILWFNDSIQKFFAFWFEYYNDYRIEQVKSRCIFFFVDLVLCEKQQILFYNLSLEQFYCNPCSRKKNNRIQWSYRCESICTHQLNQVNPFG